MRGFLLPLVPVCLFPAAAAGGQISPTSYSQIPWSSPASVFDVNTHPENVYGLGPATTLNTGNVFDVRRLFGGNYGTDSVEFTDETQGFVDSILVSLSSPARLGSFYLYLGDDGTNGDRSASDFRLYAGSTLLDDVRILNSTGRQNYTGVYGSRYIKVTDAVYNAPLSSKYTLQFVQNQSGAFGGVRAYEFTAFAAVSQPPPGDANLDGTVDFSDLLILAQHYGQSGTWVDGDFNSDGRVNFDDLLILAQNYGRSQPGGITYSTQPAPEPTSALALLIVMALSLRRR